MVINSRFKDKELNSNSKKFVDSNDLPRKYPEVLCEVIASSHKLNNYPIVLESVLNYFYGTEPMTKFMKKKGFSNNLWVAIQETLVRAQSKSAAERNVNDILTISDESQFGESKFDRIASFLDSQDDFRLEKPVLIKCKFNTKHLPNFRLGGLFGQGYLPSYLQEHKILTIHDLDGKTSEELLSLGHVGMAKLITLISKIRYLLLDDVNTYITDLYDPKQDFGYRNFFDEKVNF